MIDDETLNKLKLYLIDILNDFVHICEENNLTYFLDGGTLLGAVRHNGFIPWDDDIDVAMPRKDFEKFLDLFPNHKMDKYYILSNRLSTSNYYHSKAFARLCKNETIYAEPYRENENDYCGIFIDILPYDNCILFLLPLHSQLIKFTKKILLIKTKRKLKFNIKYIFCKFISFFITTNFSDTLWKKSYTLFNNINTKYISIFSGLSGYKRDTHNLNIIYPLTSIQFENKFYKVPNNCDSFLKTLYGDYMTIPPLEKRIGHEPLYIIFGDE